MQKIRPLKIKGVIFVLTIGGPFIINILFQNTYFYTTWSAGDALSYYGALLSFGIVAFTLYQTQKNYLKDTREKVMPFLITEKLDIERKVNKSQYIQSLINNNSEKDASCMQNSCEEKINGVSYQELICKDCNFLIKDDEILYSNKLSEEEENRKRSGNLYYKILKEDKTDFICVPFSIRNVGAGVAVTMKVTIQEIGTDKKAESKAINLNNNESFTMYLIMNNNNLENENYKEEHYNISYLTKDIYGHKYEQKQTFIVEYNVEKDGQKYVCYTNLDDFSHIVLKNAE